MHADQLSVSHTMVGMCSRTAPQALRDDLRCDDLEWHRGHAWAFEQAIGLVWYYADSNPAMSRLGRRTLERIQRSPL